MDLFGDLPPPTSSEKTEKGEIQKIQCMQASTLALSPIEAAGNLFGELPPENANKDSAIEKRKRTSRDAIDENAPAPKTSKIWRE